jgi:hypothetical protein
VVQVAEFQTVRQRVLIPWLVLVDANGEGQLEKRVIAEPLVQARAQSSLPAPLLPSSRH